MDKCSHCARVGAVGPSITTDPKICESWGAGRARPTGASGLRHIGRRKVPKEPDAARAVPKAPGQVGRLSHMFVLHGGPLVDGPASPAAAPPGLRHTPGRWAPCPGHPCSQPLQPGTARPRGTKHTVHRAAGCTLQRWLQGDVSLRHPMLGATDWALAASVAVPSRANPANLSRVEPQRNEGSRETAPVPACADFTPETPFQKSLTAPGGVGLFVLRIWVKIVRCFAYVGMGNRYFRRNWGGGGGPL